MAMRWDIRANWYWWLAAAFLALAVWAVIAPDYLHQYLSDTARGIVFWVSLAGVILFAGAGLIAAIRGESKAPQQGHIRRMIAAYGMTLCAVGFAFFAALYFWPAVKEGPGANTESITDSQLPGFAAVIFIKMGDVTKIRRKYVLDFATPEGAQASFYQSASNIFTFAVTDTRKESYPIEIPLGPAGIPLGEWSTVLFEEGSTNNASLLRVFVNGALVASRDLAFTVDLGSRDWRTVVGADLAGENGGAYGLQDLLVFATTLPIADRKKVFEYYANIAKDADNAPHIQFEPGQYLQSSPDDKSLSGPKGPQDVVPQVPAPQGTPGKTSPQTSP